MRSSPFRTTIAVLTDVLFIWAAAVALLMVIRFFGALAANPAASSFARVADRLVFPLDARVVTTPYGGVFEVAAAYTVVILLLVEWLLSGARRRVRVGGTPS
jgi:hypothetical protein